MASILRRNLGADFEGEERAGVMREDDSVLGANSYWYHPENGGRNGEASNWRAQESFETELPIIPNTPQLRAADVGMSFLDDVLASEAGEITPYSGDGNEKEEQVDLAEEKENGSKSSSERDIDEETEKQLKAMHQLLNLPKPGIVNVGFDTKGSFLGKQYNPTDADQPNRIGFSRMRELEDRPLNPGGLAIWDDREEKQKVIDLQGRFAGRQDLRFPDFFKHGIVHVPSEGETNCFRTVVIGNLPANVELRDVLQRVRGGEIVSAILVSTESITGSKSALVQFVNGAAAEGYAAFASKHPIFFGKDEEKVEAEITLINTPTYPLTNGQKNLLFNHKQTRCLRISSFPTSLSLAGLQRSLAGVCALRASSFVEMYFDFERTLHLEFSSLMAASVARGILGSYFLYRALNVGRDPDPCAGALEELLDEVHGRRPLFPKGGFVDGTEERHFAERDDELSSDSEYEEEITPRKRLAALENQKVEIPSFSGKGIASSSWADEVNGELDYPPAPQTSTSSPAPAMPVVPRNSPESIAEFVNIITTEDINKKMVDQALWGKDDSSGLQKPPVGLAGSKYATPLPGFKDNVTDIELNRCRPTVLAALDKEKSSGSSSIHGETSRRIGNVVGTVKQTLPNRYCFASDVAKQYQSFHHSLHLQLTNSPTDLPTDAPTNISKGCLNDKEVVEAKKRDLPDVMIAKVATSAMHSPSSSPDVIGGIDDPKDTLAHANSVNSIQSKEGINSAKPENPQPAPVQLHKNMEESSSAGNEVEHSEGLSQLSQGREEPRCGALESSKDPAGSVESSAVEGNAEIGLSTEVERKVRHGSMSTSSTTTEELEVVHNPDQISLDGGSEEKD
ncbi:hypothetical protein G7Y89_g10605 [Cudoniella acicularis]|uniref:RRM domain-containing protein n=1 Tax=Cudoniella acicularis TaxID=354080 RepID=A0A8H4RF78_9HELO|nr:hypothetical protein G7Y89_g10605 [Cudoniella acicularis]